MLMVSSEKIEIPASHWENMRNAVNCLISLMETLDQARHGIGLKKEQVSYCFKAFRSLEVRDNNKITVALWIREQRKITF